MPVNTSEIINLVSKICEEENLRVAIKESMKGGLIAGGTTMIGGLLGGPIGLAVGGAVGGCTAAYLSQGKFRSVASIINNDLTVAQRESLANSVRAIVRDVNPTDAAALALFICQPTIKERLIQEVIGFFQSQLHMAIID